MQRDLETAELVLRAVLLLLDDAEYDEHSAILAREEIEKYFEVVE